MKNKFFIGIDPGKSGGFAMTSETYESGDAMCDKMPETEREIYELLEKYKQLATLDGRLFANIESVHAFPGGQGVSSTFKFGYNYGLLCMALVALKIPFERVSPTKWQGAILGASRKGESKTEHKNRLKQKAQELFPMINKITHATADALLLAHYNRQIYQK